MIRPATVADLPDILRLIAEPAAYEREPEAAQATVDDLRTALFPPDGQPTAFAHVVETDVAGEQRIVGMALWYLSFSTWTGKNGIWLEDLFVEPEHRGHGYGKDLVITLARICHERGYPRLEWWVLDWNAPSIAFYRGLGANAEDSWTTFRLSGEALDALAS